MSGIVGIINLNGAPVDRELLGRMTDFMTFRGPDAQEIWIDGNVGFGHTMLRTTFEAETEKQPLTLDGRVWLTADARIDGRAELIADLEATLRRRLGVPVGSNGHAAALGHGHETRIPNDAELILLAYEAWGEDCAKHLIGDFAFAIWDSRDRKLFCARDHFGVKQFYYARTQNSLVFSNTLNCARLHQDVSSELNEIAIGDYLLFGINQDLTSTTFTNIQRLAQASSLASSHREQRIRRFWTPPADGNIRLPKFGDYVEQFRHLFSLAVGDRLRTPRISISMSGGLDSPSVAAMALPHLGQHANALHGFVVVYDRLIPDRERHFSALAAEALKIPVTHIPADDFLLYEAEKPDDLKQPEPFLMNPTAAQYNKLLCAMANFSRVALSGYDGDALMTEPPNSTFAMEAKSLMLNELIADLSWFFHRGRLPPIGVRTLFKRMIGSHPRKSYPPDWIEQSFRRRLNLQDRWREFTSESPKAHPTRPYAFRLLTSTSWAPLFEGYDPGSHKLQLEVRHPMIDVRLVKFLLGIPSIPWCVDKEILRVAMAGKLPEVILNRPKTPLAGNPALHLVEESSVESIDNFEPVPLLGEFVRRGSDYQVAGQKDQGKLWENLRPFGLNHWLKYSLPNSFLNEDANDAKNNGAQPGATTRNQEAIPSAHVN